MSVDEDLLRIERALARDAREYLGRRSRELEVKLSSDLDYLLTWHWHFRELPRWTWFDGLILDRTTFETRTSHRIDIRGLMIWAETGKDSRQWSDVFSAEVCAKDDNDRPEYVLRFGRKGFEGRKVPYDNCIALMDELKGKDHWGWAYVFRSNDTAP
jgi:hypothetical protein